MDRNSGNPETTDADCRADNDKPEVGESEENLLEGVEVVAPVHVEPENAWQAEREPTGEQSALERWLDGPRQERRRKTYDQTEQVAEDGNRLGDDPRDDPECRRQANPGADAAGIALVHDVGVAEQTDVDVLDGNVAQNNTCDNDGGHGDSVRNLSEDGAG